jgi:hypothetical protein
MAADSGETAPSGAKALFLLLSFMRGLKPPPPSAQPRDKKILHAESKAAFDFDWRLLFGVDESRLLRCVIEQSYCGFGVDQVAAAVWGGVCAFFHEGYGLLRSQGGIDGDEFCSEIGDVG